MELKTKLYLKYIKQAFWKLSKKVGLMVFKITWLPSIILTYMGMSEILKPQNFWPILLLSVMLAVPGFCFSMLIEHIGGEIIDSIVDYFYTIRNKIDDEIYEEQRRQEIFRQHIENHPRTTFSTTSIGPNHILPRKKSKAKVKKIVKKIVKKAKTVIVEKELKVGNRLDQIES